MPRKTTAHDVAKAAGVSASTVDRVLNNRGGVSKDKEQKVLRAARRLRLDRSLDLREARTLRVGVLIQPPSNPFHAVIRSAVDAENAGPNPFNIRMGVHHLNPRNPTRTATQIRDMGGRYDALIVCVTHEAQIADAVKEVGRAGKPVITLATAINAPLGQYYVGPDNTRSGRVAGDMMGRFLAPGGGDLLVIAGLLSMTGQAERDAGFRAVLRERYPACRVVATVESHEDALRAGALATQALRDFSGLRGIYSASAGAQDVANAITASGRQGVRLITHELTPERHRLLKEGRIDALIDQEPALEVRKAVEVIAAHYGRLDDTPTDVMTPVRLHTIETC